MSANVNIQSLFAQLRLEHFHVYLAGRGWCRDDSTVGDVARFELPDGDDDPFVLLLPVSSRLPQCEDLLQRAVFNLSGIEDRQPAEIARDLLTVDIGNQGDNENFGRPTERPPLRLRLQNHDLEPLSLEIASRGGGHALMPGEAIEIVVHSTEGEPVEIGFQRSTIRIDDRPS